jgi:formate dehydrogenase subunit gamma
MLPQPSGTQIKLADVAGRSSAVIAAHAHLEGALLPILHGIQDEFGFVPTDSLPVIADALNISKAEAHGVVTFYHDYRDRPAGRHVLKICRAEACQAMGCEALVRRAEARLGVECGGGAANGQVTLEAVYCLGLCAMSPAAMIDGEPVARLNAAKLESLLSEIGA